MKRESLTEPESTVLVQAYRLQPLTDWNPSPDERYVYEVHLAIAGVVARAFVTEGCKQFRTEPRAIAKGERWAASPAGVTAIAAVKADWLRPKSKRVPLAIRCRRSLPRERL